MQSSPFIVILHDSRSRPTLCCSRNIIIQSFNSSKSSTVRPSSRNWIGRLLATLAWSFVINDIEVTACCFQRDVRIGAAVTFVIYSLYELLADLFLQCRNSRSGESSPISEADDVVESSHLIVSCDPVFSFC